MDLKDLDRTLNGYYQPETFKDYIPMGMLIEGKLDIQKGATAVSFDVETVKKAVEANADFLIVHHGHGFWNNQSKVLVGGFKEKVKLMLENQISLFAYHLPMDAQPEIGNNFGLLQALELYKLSGFLPMGPNYIGLIGEYESPMDQSQFLELVEKNVGPVNFSFLFGKKEIKKVAICTGGAASSISDALKEDVDLFITGEAKEDTFSFCRDERFNFVAAGHYRTEVFGPKLLAHRLTEKEKLPTEFLELDVPV